MRLWAQYGWAPNWLKVGGAAPGFEPWTSSMRVRSASRYATGAPLTTLIFLNSDFLKTRLPDSYFPFVIFKKNQV